MNERTSSEMVKSVYSLSMKSAEDNRKLGEWIYFEDLRSIQIHPRNVNYC